LHKIGFEGLIGFDLIFLKRSLLFYSWLPFTWYRATAVSFNLGSHSWALGGCFG